ncbi:hypothetical protein FPRO05_13084 [Fusarium proliferatum]|uniref:Uncharacterized protein n=1 Tax=Gibberella intermedia TaxID=948311 RepID=A0A365N2N8_GIBIN|nr:hypothetical protein FPRO05_13084 [Fusarium proliferatum]
MCHSCNAKGYLCKRCKDGRGPVSRVHSDGMEMAARPAETYRPGYGNAGVAPLPRHLEARGISSSRATGSSSRVSSILPTSSSQVSSSQTNRSYEPSIMSADSCQEVADGLMSLRYEIQDMGQRIEDLIALRKQQSHRAKRVNEEEYEQALNSPSMIVLYEDYKLAVKYSVDCQRAVFQRRAAFSHNYNRATENDQLEIYALQEKWVRAAINAAEKRLNYLQQYPFAYRDKGAIIGHVEAANTLLNSAWNGLRQIERNKEVTTEDVQKACDVASKTYAKKILNWPDGRLEKPKIFKVESHDKEIRNVDDCIERFIGHLHDVFEVSPPKDLPIYPHAFVVMDGSCLKADATATLVLAHKPEDEWRVQHCSVPIEVELGLAVESIRLGDVTETDMLDEFTN